MLDDESILEKNKSFLDHLHKMYPRGEMDENHITLKLADAGWMSEEKARKLHEEYHTKLRIPRNDPNRVN